MLCLFFAALVAIVTLYNPVMAADSQKPNILVIWGDDIGQSSISAYTKGERGGGGYAPDGQTPTWQPYHFQDRRTQWPDRQERVISDGRSFEIGGLGLVGQKSHLKFRTGHPRDCGQIVTKNFTKDRILIMIRINRSHARC